MTVESVVPSTDLGPSISCFPSGKQFFINAPTFDVEDMAWALGMMCRYNGHCRHFYSVAEHSVIVSLLMQELKLGDPWEGLWHDGQEAYQPDMVSGWKRECQGWREFEARVERPLRDHFALPSAKTYGCQQADRIAFYLEWHYLKAVPTPTHFHDDAENQEPLRRAARTLIDAGWRTLNLYPQEATKAFLKRYDELRP
jgi:hypothetical protein